MASHNNDILLIANLGNHGASMVYYILLEMYKHLIPSL